MVYIGSMANIDILSFLQYERYKDFGAEDFLLSTGGIICPNPVCGEGMMLEDSPGSNIRCATCQVSIVLNLCGERMMLGQIGPWTVE